MRVNKSERMRETKSHLNVKRRKNMCVALPGKVLEVNGDTAVVDFSGNRVNAAAGLLEVKPGDRVLVHAGCILQIVSQSEAEELEGLLAELSM